MDVAILINEDFSAWKLRQNIIKALVAEDINVTVICPDGAYVEKLIDLGARHVHISMHRFASPIRDLKLCFDMYRILRRLKPDLVHTMTIKPNTYGAIAAWLAGVPKIVALVCGLGFSFLPKQGWKQAVRRTVATALYRLAGKVYEKIWFANPDDRDLFVELGIVDSERTLVTLGEGVDTVEYAPHNVPEPTIKELRDEFSATDSTVVVFMMVARVVWSKGVKEFVEASQLAQSWEVPTKFVLVGPLESDSPDTVPLEYLEANASAQFAHVGFRSDVKELVAMADIVTLPSFYREGCPLVLIEGLSMGKPIVTTDNVGCRQVILEGENGFLVPVQDKNSFANAVKTLVHDEALRKSMGQRSRSRALTEFADEIIMDEVLTNLYQVPLEAPSTAEAA